MIATYRRSYDEEMESGGLIILTAYYGCFPLYIDPFLPLIEQSTGNIIDVTVPLQCMIISSQLICNDTRGKSWLPGFYDPCTGLDKKLVFRYVFKGHEHQAIIKDNETFRAPLKEHLNTLNKKVNQQEMEQEEMKRREKEGRNGNTFHMLHGQTKYMKLIKRFVKLSLILSCITFSFFSKKGKKDKIVYFSLHV